MSGYEPDCLMFGSPSRELEKSIKNKHGHASNEENAIFVIAWLMVSIVRIENIW